MPKRVEAAMVVGLVEGDVSVVVGRGRIAPDVPLPPDGKTIFLIGSITKVFTGLLFADAVISGRVRKDAEARQFLPDMPIPTWEGASPTLLQLATHTSGLPEMFENWRPSPREFADLLRNCKLAAPPGERVVYSNVGYSILGDAVARAWGQPFEGALRNRILDPLGMSQTAYMWTSPDADRAQGYDAAWRSVPRDVNVPTLAPCCVLESSVDDLLRLVRAYLDGAPRSMQSALGLAAEPVLQGTDSLDGVMVDMGWFTTLPDGLLSKEGLMEGYRSSVVVDRKARRGVVVLANQTEVDTYRVLSELLRDVARSRDSGTLGDTLEALPPSATASQAVFEDGIQLVGYRAPPSVSRGSTLPLTFYFKTDGPASDDFRISLYGEGKGARHRLHADHYPPGNTMTWPRGRIVVDAISVPVPRDAEPGERIFYVGFSSGSRRLRVLSGCNEGNRACGPSVRVE